MPMLPPAATDPVAVVALFRTLGVPKRLQVLLEGESLFNDGTAIVVFNVVLTIAITRQFSIFDSIIDFVILQMYSAVEWAFNFNDKVTP